MAPPRTPPFPRDGLDERRLVVSPPERGEDAVDPIAGVAEHPLDVPFAEPLQDVVTHCLVVDRSRPGLGLELKGPDVEQYRIT